MTGTWIHAWRQSIITSSSDNKCPKAWRSVELMTMMTVLPPAGGWYRLVNYSLPAYSATGRSVVDTLQWARRRYVLIYLLASSVASWVVAGLPSAGCDQSMSAEVRALSTHAHDNDDPPRIEGLKFQLLLRRRWVDLRIESNHDF